MELEKARRRARELFGRPFGTIFSGDDHAFLFDLLNQHPRAKEKIGSGVKHFTVKNSKDKSKGFFLVRPDGTEEVFSYRKCLKLCWSYS